MFVCEAYYKPILIIHLFVKSKLHNFIENDSAFLEKFYNSKNLYR